jgi:hypothetical protein
LQQVARGNIAVICYNLRYANMTTILTKLEHGHYVMTEAQVESLALERYNNAAVVLRADSTYLKGLVVAAQAKLGNGRKTRVKINAEAQHTVLNEVHERFYAAVLRGVTTHDVASDDALDSKEKQRRSLERNRRSAFARSAKSTLSAYITAGGDLRTLDVEAVTKAALRKAIARPNQPTRPRVRLNALRGRFIGPWLDRFASILTRRRKPWKRQ